MMKRRLLIFIVFLIVMVVAVLLVTINWLEKKEIEEELSVLRGRYGVCHPDGEAEESFREGMKEGREVKGSYRNFIE